MRSSPDVTLLELGEVPYGQALALQYELRSRLIDGTGPEGSAGWLLVLEHPPVVTLGKRGEMDHLVQPELLRRAEVECFKIDRGGEATFHAPGQLVIYPVLELEQFGLGVVDVVRGLAKTISDALAAWDVPAAYDTDHPGVWTQNDSPKRKIASVGMRVRRGVSTHGAAINLHNDMSPFSMIVPCGMPGAPMARLADYVDRDDEQVREASAPLPFAREMYTDIEELLGADLVEDSVELPAPEDWVESVDY